MRFGRRPMLGNASAVKGRPPGVGEQFRTRIADSKEGIIFEIGRMRETVLHQRGDALVNDQAGWNINAWAELRGLSDAERRTNLEMARAQYHWLRGCFQYVPDPYRMEKLQTSNRVVRMSRIPRQIIMAATAPIYASLNGVDLSEMSPEMLREAMPSLASKISGDCIPYSQKIIVRERSQRRYRVMTAGELRKSWKNYHVPSYNEADEKCEFKTIKAFIEKGPLPVYQVRLQNGVEFKCTENHELYVFERISKGEFELVTMTLKELLEKKESPHGDRFSIAMATRIPEANSLTEYKKASKERSLGMSKRFGLHESSPFARNPASQLWVEGLYVAEGWSNSIPTKKAFWAKNASIGMNNPHAITALKTNLATLGEKYGEPGLWSTGVKSVKKIGVEECCDLTVSGNHNFILDGGVLVHNCDEGASTLATLCAACGMETRFMLGSLAGSEWFHHVWAEADILGNGSDESYAMGAMDVTEPEFDDVGKFASMDRYKAVNIFRDN